MEAILDKAMELSNCIKSSKVYTDYKSAESKILIDTVLITKISYFKKVQLEYETKILNNIEPTFEEEKNISKLYTDLCLNDVVKIFLEKEKEILDLISKVQNIICESYDINTSFIN